MPFFRIMAGLLFGDFFRSFVALCRWLCVTATYGSTIEGAHGCMRRVVVFVCAIAPVRRHSWFPNYSWRTGAPARQVPVWSKENRKLGFDSNDSLLTGASAYQSAPSLQPPSSSFGPVPTYCFCVVSLICLHDCTSPFRRDALWKVREQGGAHHPSLASSDRNNLMSPIAGKIFDKQEKKPPPPKGNAVLVRFFSYVSRGNGSPACCRTKRETGAGNLLRHCR